MIRTGIFGGSFNPIHNGHIALGRAFLKEAQLDELWFVVSPQNPLKAGDSTLLEDTLRLEMTRIALASEKGMVASDVEFHLPKPSYMITTLNTISEQYPERQPILLIGGDNWEHFSRWYHYEEILEKYEICIYPRDNDAQDEFKEEKVKVIHAPLLNISSTMIREKIQKGESIRNLVPKTVADYIKRNHLYMHP